MARWTTHPRWTAFRTRAGARWIAAALASFMLLGYVVRSHRAIASYSGSGFIQNLLPTGNKPTAVDGTPLVLLPAWIDTPPAFDTADHAVTAELDRSLALHPRLVPTIQAFLARPVLSHEQAVALNEVQCPRTQLDEQVNKDQLKGEHAHWVSLTTEKVIEMRRAAVQFLERRAGEEGEGALLGPGFGPEGLVVEKGSRGVVLAAGNKRTAERAALCIKELQRLGWKGGVEVWHFEGELESEKERGLLEALGVAIHMVSSSVPSASAGTKKRFDIIYRSPRKRRPGNGRTLSSKPKPSSARRSMRYSSSTRTISRSPMSRPFSMRHYSRTLAAVRRSSGRI